MGGAEGPWMRLEAGRTSPKAQAAPHSSPGASVYSVKTQVPTFGSSEQQESISPSSGKPSGAGPVAGLRLESGSRCGRRWGRACSSQGGCRPVLDVLSAGSQPRVAGRTQEPQFPVFPGSDCRGVLGLVSWTLGGAPLSSPDPRDLGAASGPELTLPLRSFVGR